jgi:hypothetical protein
MANLGTGSPALRKQLNNISYLGNTYVTNSHMDLKTVK